jgi:hypothetical protein
VSDGEIRVCIGLFVFIIHGRRMTISGALQKLARHEISLITSESGEVLEAASSIYFYPGGIIDARIPIDDFDVDDEDFFEHLMNAFSDGDLDMNLRSISIELSAIEETLNIVGIDPYNHVSYDDDTDYDRNDESDYLSSDEVFSDY